MLIFEYEDERRRSRGPISSALGVTVLAAVFLGWLVLGGLATRIGIRQTEAFQYYDQDFGLKLAAFQALDHQDQVIIGSSRIHRQLDPETIETYCDGKTYNLGIGGATSSNTKFLLDWVLSQPDGPEQIWIEPLGADNYVQLDTYRNLLYSPIWPAPVWHDRVGEMAADAEKSEIEGALAIEKKSLRAYFSVGAFWALRDGKPDPLSLMEPFRDEIASKGFVALDFVFTKPNSRTQQRENLLKGNPDYYEDQFASYNERYASWSEEMVRDKVLSDISALVSGVSKDDLHRIGVIYSPKLPESQLPIDTVSFEGVQIPVVTFPVDENPYLTDKDLWMDVAHLNYAGARLLSKSFADQVCGGEGAIH